MKTNTQTQTKHKKTFNIEHTNEEYIPLINELKKLNMEYKEKLWEAKEHLLPEYNYTSEFIKYLRQKIKNGELISITIRGEVASGKSTVALAIKKIINDMLLEYKKRDKPADEYSTIYSDQVEFIKSTTKEIWHECCVIDEYNSLAEGGSNASTLFQQLKTYQDIFAQQGRHRIFCSPAGAYDLSSTVILDVEGGDKKTGITTLRLMYRDPSDERRMINTIGHIEIDVRDTMKQKWYEKYRKKKFEKMKFLQVHGVRDIRELEFHKTALIVYEKLENLVSTGKVPFETIKNKTDRVCRELRMINSMFGVNDIITIVKGLVNPKTEIVKLQKEYMKNAVSYNIAKTDDKRKYYKKEMENINLAIQLQEEEFKEAKEESKRMEKIYSEWLALAEQLDN